MMDGPGTGTRVMSRWPRASLYRGEDMARVIVNFSGLAPYGIKNWTTLRRWQKKLGFPSGFMLGMNTRVWFLDEVEAWVAARAEAPPDILKPAPSAATEGSRPEAEASFVTPRHSESDFAAHDLATVAHFHNGGGR